MILSFYDAIVNSYKTIEEVRDSGYSKLIEHGPLKGLNLTGKPVAIELPDYIKHGIAEEDALKQEVICYNKHETQVAEILFCAFQIVHNIYLKARIVNPEDNQSEG